MGEDSYFRNDASTAEDWAELRPLRICFGFGPRLGRRLKALARDLGCSPDVLAGRIVAHALIPNRGELARIVYRDLHESGLASVIELRRRR